ncbi:LANO_0D02542g1_1 [Lachancea nothofagi CBS 11611]|uniref:Pre-mRNA-splicing factor n=1 Tax=Lachancea nothofagi CBS 11611 TaxID=1266666 RepID=A0A1G4JEE2_9SACH|nr:LANO_0D02542g1_1 [Lachancea nothofagi CBS 11611]
MAGFSVSLKGQKVGKKGITGEKKRKRANVFNESDLNDPKKSKIRLTHVDEYKKAEEQELVIKPVADLTAVQRPDNTGMGPKSDLKFGFNAGKESNPTEGSRISNSINGPQNSSNLLEDTQQEDYDNVPIEKFGDALLRGMGWDGKAEHDKISKSSSAKAHNKLRPSLLGLGAKAVRSTQAEEKVKPALFLPVIKVPKKGSDL